jgi:hypothetical protein
VSGQCRIAVRCTGCTAGATLISPSTRPGISAFGLRAARKVGQGLISGCILRVFMLPDSFCGVGLWIGGVRVLERFLSVGAMQGRMRWT